MTYSYNEQLAIVVAVLLGTILSIIFSFKLIFTITKEKQWRTYERLLVGMSVGDLVYSFAILPVTLPAPRNSPNAIFAIGNTTTCDVQGFFTQFGLSVTLYNASLCLYFLGVIRFNMSHEKMLGLEHWFHATPLLFALISSVVGLATGSFNYDQGGCWFADLPNGCTEDEQIPCERGEYAVLLMWVFAGSEVLLTWAVMIISMVLIYLAVRKMESRNLEYNFEYNSAVRNNSVESIRDIEQYERHKSQIVSKQAYMYCLTYFNLYVWAFVYRSFETSDGGLAPAWLVVIGDFFASSEGVFNYLVFTYRRHLNRASPRKRRSTDIAKGQGTKFRNEIATGHVNEGRQMVAHEISIVNNSVEVEDANNNAA